jgi:triacylglycerol lipase
VNDTRTPVLLVHGIWDTSASFSRLSGRLRHDREVHAVDLRPNDGRASILELANTVRAEADQLLETTGAPRIDVVGFSMGALVARAFIQRVGGRERVRRFVSVSGPHAGTWTAWALPMAGARDMRPGSALLKDLASDADPWGPVEVHAIYTELDLMIVPPRSSVLRGANSLERTWVPMHRLMLWDASVLASIQGRLDASV